MNVNGTNIDTLAQEILAEFDESDEEWLDTVELRERLKLGAGSDGSRRNQNRKVKLRFEKLSEAGLGEVRSGGTDEDGRTLPKELSLTDAGRELIENYGLGDGVSEESDESLPEYIERIGREQAQLEEELQEEIDELESDIDNLHWVLGVLLNELGVDKERVEPYGIDTEKLWQ
jgi:hypothetical protein